MSENLRNHCDVLLLSLLGDDALIAVWWNSPNLAFGGRHPEEVWTTDPGSVWQYVVSYAIR